MARPSCLTPCPRGHGLKDNRLGGNGQTNGLIENMQSWDVINNRNWDTEKGHASHQVFFSYGLEMGAGANARQDDTTD